MFGNLYRWLRRFRLPAFVLRRTDGTARMKCPKCGAKITISLSPVEKGQPAFHCTACNEKGTWQ